MIEEKGGKTERMESYNILNETQREEIQNFIDRCSAFDYTCQEVYLGNEFNVYPKMKTFFLEREGENLAGFLYLYADHETTAEISAWVHPEKRRSGIFTRLFEEAVLEIKKYSYKKVLFKTEKAFSDVNKVLAGYPVNLSHKEYHMVADNGSGVTEKDIPGFSLREAQEKELGQLAEIMKAAFAGEEFEADVHVRTTFRTEKALLFTALYQNTPVGCVSVDTSGRRNYLYALCIDPKYQGNGYGRKMLCRTVNLLARLYDKEVSLDVDEENKTAIPLYQSCGFRQASELVYYAMDL